MYRKRRTKDHESRDWLVLLLLIHSIAMPGCRALTMISSSRRRLMLQRLAAGSLILSSAIYMPVAAAVPSDPLLIGRESKQRQNYPYSDVWTGTALPLMDLSDASTETSCDGWNMGRWPDPILRRSATAVDKQYFGTEILQRACRLLEATAITNSAVGLAAQQCGIDARIVYLEKPKPITMVNPHIIKRSPEADMLVWTEECLVLPPTFRATVLRDAWVDVEYYDWKGTLHQIHLKGEPARAAQHELDHDRGILVLDHVGLEELQNDAMRELEKDGHDERMLIAYSRDAFSPLSSRVQVS